MRHGIAGNRLGRNGALLKATIRDMAKDTLVRQRICTTKAKAKEARKMVDRLITLGKKGTLDARRRAFAILCSHQLVSALFEKIAPRFRERQGGYTRIIPLGYRRGDGAEMTYLELTEKDALTVNKPKRRAAKAKDAASSAVSKDAVEDAVVETAEPAAPKAARPARKKSTEAAEKKPKTDKKIVGGIKKIFRRKTAE